MAYLFPRIASEADPTEMAVDATGVTGTARCPAAGAASAAAWPVGGACVRADLHCHSDASNEADEAVLNAIQCPESFSAPADVYDQAKRRGMDFVTLTDHDSLAGAATLAQAATQAGRSDVLIGEELTCYFPEDHCKIHLLVWGLSDDDHAALQAVAHNIYDVARAVAERQLAHAVAHPVYRQNDRLERWHLERLVLLFKGFETLNGAHSVLHREAVESLLAELTEDRITELAAAHQIIPLWPEPHVKSRTGGSDDHGLFNVGRTWTEFPPGTRTLADLLECLRTGRCRPGGEAGSSLKLAHNFYSVGVRYYGRKMRGETSPTSLTGMMLHSMVGERRAIRRRDYVKAKVKSRMSAAGRRVLRPFRKAAPPPTGTALLMQLFLESCGRQLGEHSAIGEALSAGRPAIGESASGHADLFAFLSAINRDVAGGIAESVERSLLRGEIGGVFDAIASIAAHQFLQLPYYFALFHQNRERALLPRLARGLRQPERQTLKLGVFTDTFDEINGVGRFIADMSRQAERRGRSLIVHTSTANPRVNCPSRKNFTPLLSRPLPLYPDQPLTVPPIAEVLEWADRQQFDAIHVHTPGPMGLCGWLVAQMLRVPVLGTYHTDFPQYVHDLTGDHRLVTATGGYMRWFYAQLHTVFSRTRDYRGKLIDLGLQEQKLAVTPPGVDTDKFTPEAKDSSLWAKLKVQQPHKLLYAGRVSKEKNLPFLVDAFRALCTVRDDVALIIAGDGPWMADMQAATAGLPVHYLGIQNDTQLPALYASSDLFVFPSKTDTLGQVVLEAQACGLPVLVSDTGGPQEVMDHDITGLVLPTDTPSTWARAIDTLLNDTPRRLRMSRSAPTRVARYSLGHLFETFWDEHVKAATQAAAAAVASITRPTAKTAMSSVAAS